MYFSADSLTSNIPFARSPLFIIWSNRTISCTFNVDIVQTEENGNPFEPSSFSFAPASSAFVSAGS